MPLVTFLATTADRVEWAVRPGIGRWWLPYNYARHGHAIDSLFNAIFWLTTIVFVLTQAALIYFLIKYRSRRGVVRKAKYYHGNTRLEMFWTAIPAVILAVLALASKAVWDHYRYAEEYSNEKQTEVLVIAEQFKWNFVYPGKDGKFGQYLDYPRPSDPRYRGKPYAEAMKLIERDILENPLGQNKNFDDPAAKAGQDDDYDPQPDRALILPVDRPIAVNLSSKDVIHDFFLPNFRVKLDALPGMMGRINFTAEPEALGTEAMNVTDPRVIDKPIWIDSATPGAQLVQGGDVYQTTYSLNDKSGQPIITNLAKVDANVVTALKTAGVDKVTVVTKPFEIVCEQLCGTGHTQMRGEIYFVSGAQYDRFIAKEDPKATQNQNKTNVSSISLNH